MKHDTNETKIARRSALIFVPLTLELVGLFFLISLTIGGYPVVARLGGAVWIGLLTLIVTMPAVISTVKKRIMQG